MRIKDCKHYAVVNIFTATSVLQEQIMRDEPFNEEADVYEENEQPGLNGHQLTYIGYINIKNSFNFFKSEPNSFKLHIFVDNYWGVSSGEK